MNWNEGLPTEPRIEVAVPGFGQATLIGFEPRMFRVLGEHLGQCTLLEMRAESDLVEYLQGAPLPMVAKRLAYWFIPSGQGSAEELRDIAATVLGKLREFARNAKERGILLYAGNEALKAAREKAWKHWLPATTFDDDSEGNVAAGNKPQIVLWADFWGESELDRVQILTHELTHLLIGTWDFCAAEWDVEKKQFSIWTENRAQVSQADLLENADSFAGFCCYAGKYGHP